MSSFHESSSLAPAIMTYDDTSPEENHERQWFEQVLMFSSCAITNKRDRLIAFTGIAQSYAQDLGPSLNDHLAGIWRQDLLSSLCFTSTRQKTSYRSDAYRAPSWSWESLEGPVTTEEFLLYQAESTIAPLCEVVDAKVIHQSKHNKGGEVKGGVIHLKGHLVELILGSQIFKWPSNREIEELDDELDHAYNFDEGQNVDSR